MRAHPTSRRDDAAVLRHFGIPSLRPPQQEAVDALFAGRDVLVVMSTGGGKSLCYQYPAAAGLSPAVVISPLVALMKDQVDALRRKGITAAQITAASPAAERAAAWDALAAGDLTLVYLAPEALDVIQTRARLARAMPRLLAVDEAHCISEWGESFRPSYLRLHQVRAEIGGPPTIALTATATPRTRRDILQRLALRDARCIVSGFDRPNLHLAVAPVGGEAEREVRLASIAQRAPGPAVYYAPTRRRTEALAALLRRAGVSARAYHAALPSGERAEVQEAFLANRMRAIVATCAFGMGVDKPDVRLVVHAAPPPSLEAYYQEAGRAGRDGRPGRCVLLVAPGDVDAAAARIARPVVALGDIRRLHALVRDAATGANTPLRASVDALARSLALPAHDVSRAREILLEAGCLRASEASRGHLRLLATPRRLATDGSLDDGDRQFVHRVRARFGDATERGLDVTRAMLAPLEEELALDQRLTRVAASSLLVWTPVQSGLHVSAPWSDDAVDAIRARQVRRVAYDVWRFGMVARFVQATRCRRRVLLRYFGDVAPRDSCGDCDLCRPGD